MRRNCPALVFALIAALLTLGLLAPAAAAWPALADRPSGRGIARADMDPTVDPGDDFYRFASGGWLDRTAIPADEEQYGAIQEVMDQTTVQLIGLIGLLDRLAATDDLQAGTDEWKAVQLYRQGTDPATRDAQGIAPIRPLLDEIDAIADLATFHAFQQGAGTEFLTGLFFLYGSPDLADSSINAGYLSGPFLGLPDRDFYLTDDPTYQAGQEAYVAASAALLIHAGYRAATAGQAARAVFDLERTLAEATLTRDEQQDLTLSYDPATLAELEQRYPPMDWAAYVAELGLAGVDHLIVTEPRYLDALAGIVAAADLETLKDYVKLEVLWGFAPYVSAGIAETAFALQGMALGGVTAQAPLVERVLGQLNGMVGEAIGKLYVAEYFPPEAKARILELVDTIVAAFRERIEANAWMSPATKVKALEKLSAMRVKVGYPDRWRSYETVEVRDSYAMSFLSAFRADYRAMLDGIGRPVDPDAWLVAPQTVNAFYNWQGNEIIFPAAVLQPPFFDHQADPAANFGAIGILIGHEITHGFDLQGSQLDAEGNLANWWTDEDRARFEELNRRVAEQYSAVEVLPGVFVNGQGTVTENVADLGGVQVAFAALERYLDEHGDPGPIDGFTQQQRFFLAGSVIAREKIRDEALLTQVQTDWLAPFRVRATQAFRNTGAFYEAFDVGSGDAMYLPPEERIVIW